MKKIIITIAIALLLGTATMAQDRRVAVLDPAGNAEQYVNEITREVISSVIVNTSGYAVLERAEINRVLGESRFQMSGLVDDAQIVEVGLLMGANLVFVTNLTRMGDGNYFVSARLIDVATARIEKQQITQTSRGMEDLVIVVRRTAEEMFGNLASTPISRTEGSPRLVLDRSRVYQGGKRLSTPEVLDLMGGTQAFNLFERGVFRNRASNIIIYVGAGAIVAGGVATGVAAYGSLGGDAMELVISVIGIGIIALATPAVILKIGSRRDMRNAVDMYNRTLPTRADNTTIELNFGITQNGVGLVLNF